MDDRHEPYRKSAKLYEASQLFLGASEENPLGASPDCIVYSSVRNSFHTLARACANLSEYDIADKTHAQLSLAFEKAEEALMAVAIEADCCADAIRAEEAAQ